MNERRCRYQVKEETPEVHLVPAREKVIFTVALLALLALLGRFFYLQLLHGSEYEAQAQKQYQRSKKPYLGNRGKIYLSSDEYPLVTNRYVYQVAAQPDWTRDGEAFYATVAPILATDSEATSTLKTREEFLGSLAQKRESGSLSPVVLAKHVTQESVDQLQEIFSNDKICNSAQTPCLIADREIVRYYPEKLMAAHVIGFLSKDNNEGHYGIEGGLDKELSGKQVTTLKNADVSGDGFVASNVLNQNLDGRDIYLTLDRNLQHLAETTLEEGLKTYGADRGEIIITEPKTGKILALAASPTYDPEKYFEYDTALYKNPSIVDYYEPGSTFKVITMAAAIDSGVVNPNTPCPVCGADWFIDGYRVHNWDGSHNGAIDMTTALEKSDNIALAWVGKLLGAERFQEYIKKFHFGQPLDLETEEDATTQTLATWRPIELANRAFGQGISVTSLQLVQAVGAIANEGKMMKLHLVDKAYDKASDTYYVTQPQVLEEVLTPETARTMSKMMQAAAQHGEAQYMYKNSSIIAGKTGTAQIPKKNGGGYEEEGTIASFIGFAPYDDPQFLMLVKYERPRTSIYAAETAAVTWKQLAEKLFIKFSIQAEE